MASIHHSHHPSHPSTAPLKKCATKTARSVPSARTAATPRIVVRGVKSSKHSHEEHHNLVTDDDDHDDDMNSSFLQFCAMCEKQIMVPNSSILYCSESCRRQDTSPSTNPLYGLPIPVKRVPGMLSDGTDDPFASKLPTYVPAMRPTPRSLADDRTPPDVHDGKSDIDPTEWKPAESAVAEGKSSTKLGEWKANLTRHPSSEAFRYLGKFHRSNESFASKRRPALKHDNSTISSRTTPSLSHTPTAVSSSEESVEGTPYEFVTWPVLSMPTTPVTKLTGALSLTKESKGFTYDKKEVGLSMGSATGSLKKLLGNATGDM